MLIAESEDGQQEPVAVVGTISEAQEVAERFPGPDAPPGTGRGCWPLPDDLQALGSRGGWRLLPRV
jgi:hypothetical protein